MKNYRYMFRKRNINNDYSIHNSVSTSLSLLKYKRNSINDNVKRYFSMIKRNELSQTQSLINNDQLTLINNKNDSSLTNLHLGTHIKKLNSSTSSPLIKKCSSQSVHQFDSSLSMKRNHFRLHKAPNRNLNFASFDTNSIEGSLYNKQRQLNRNISLPLNNTIYKFSPTKKKSFKFYYDIQNKIKNILNDSFNIENTKEEFPVLTKEYFDKKFGLFKTHNLKRDEVVNDIMSTQEQKEQNKNHLEKRERIETLLSKGEFYIKLNPSCAYQHRYHLANKNGFNWDEKYQYKKKDRNKIKKQIPVQLDTHSKYKRKIRICKPDNLFI